MMENKLIEEEGQGKDCLELQGGSDNCKMETPEIIKIEDSEEDGICDEDDGMDLTLLYPKTVLLTDRRNLNFIVGDNYVGDLENLDPNDNISESCSRKERSRYVPFYSFNPDDYSHDRDIKMRIRRAKTTEKYHRDMKQQVVKLTDENQRLRGHIEAQNKKMMGIIACACVKNTEAIMNCLEMELPPVTPLTVPRTESKRTALLAGQAEKQEIFKSNSTKRDSTKATVFKPLRDSTSRLESTGNAMQKPIIKVSTTTQLERNLHLKVDSFCYPTYAYFPNIQARGVPTFQSQFSTAPSILRTVKVSPPQLNNLKFVSTPQPRIRNLHTTSSSTPKVNEFQQTPATAAPMSRCFSVKPAANSSRFILVFDKSKMILKKKSTKCLSEEKMWKRLEKCDDDEGNVIDLTATVNGDIPPPKNQKQAVLGANKSATTLSEEEMWKRLETGGDDELTAPVNGDVPPPKKQKPTVLCASNTNGKCIVSGTSIVDAGKYPNVDFEAIN